jgi:glycosyltransferase involved in cell wall biosynthesis
MSTLVTHFTTQLPGGVGNATKRLHRALCRAGVESRICYGAGEPLDSTMTPAFQNRSFLWRNVAALATSWRSRQDAPGGFVTGPGWIRKTPIQAIGIMPQIVHFHWVARWLDLPSFFGSLPPGMPVVWTVRDFIPITGGCNYPGGCDGFTRGCGNCPQQKRPHAWDATRRFYRTKDRLYSGINLHFVGNSEWTTAQIRRSGLAIHAKSIRTIHNGLDVEEYQPVEKSIARKALGIPEGRFAIGFACLDFNERRKGAEILMEALKTFPAREIVLLVLGAGKWPASEIETITMGSMASPRLQSLFYSALDVFAMPSLAETFGNTTIEAMACQTPVVAYPAGGVADVVMDGKTGLMEPEIGSVAGLVRMLQWMWKHPAERAAMGIAARQRVIEKFSDSLMARRHMDMYHQLITTGKSPLVNSMNIVLPR